MAFASGCSNVRSPCWRMSACFLSLRIFYLLLVSPISRLQTHKKTSTHHQNQKSKNKTQNNQKLFEESPGPWGCAALSFCFLFFFSGCVFWKYFLQTHPPNSSYRVFPEFIVQKASLSYTLHTARCTNDTVSELKAIFVLGLMFVIRHMLGFLLVAKSKSKEPLGFTFLSNAIIY